jgi:hypothetical protein
MKITLKILDIWSLGESHRLVVRSDTDFNKFCLVSLGTGESSNPMPAKEIYDYLVYGKNPLVDKNRKDANILPIFKFQSNLKNRLKESLTGLNQFANIIIWSEDVTDETVLSYHNAPMM